MNKRNEKYKELIRKNRKIVLLIVLTSTIFLVSAGLSQNFATPKPEVCNETNAYSLVGFFSIIGAFILLGFFFGRITPMENRGSKHE